VAETPSQSPSPSPELTKKFKTFRSEHYAISDDAAVGGPQEVSSLVGALYLYGAAAIGSRLHRAALRSARVFGTDCEGGRSK
jgi:hypothetical protein